jgi:hypothetical protein
MLSKVGSWIRRNRLGKEPCQRRERSGTISSSSKSTENYLGTRLGDYCFLSSAQQQSTCSSPSWRHEELAGQERGLITGDKLSSAPALKPRYLTGTA